MTVWRSISVARLTAASILASTYSTALLGAQPAAKCEPNYGSPYQIASGQSYVSMAANSRKPDEIPKHLSNSIRVLTDNPEKINNELGRQMLLVRTYSQFLQRDNAPYVMKRSEMGYTTNGTGTQNLLLALDSAASVVERVAPQCKELVGPYRSRFFTELHNKFVAAINADKTDSASYFAHLEAELAVNDPRTWNDLGAVFARQQKQDSSMIAMSKIIALSGSDTLYKKIKQQSRYNLAVINLTNAETATGADKDRELKLGRSLLEDYLKDSPGEPTAQQALGRALRLSGDTAAVQAIFGDMISAPDRFTDIQLFEAASNAASSGRDKDAVALFENGLKKNPYHRVALLNLANVLFQLKDTEKMGPVSARLLAVDPNSQDSWRMHAGYWQLKQRAETDPAKKKAFGDSTLAAINSRDKINPRVTVFSASRAGAAYQVQGNLNNDGEKSATFTLKFELLDATGAVVATKDVAVGPVDAGASASFSLKLDAPKAVAYRYAPLR